MITTCHTIRATAERLSLSRNTIIRLVAAGKLACIRPLGVGRHKPVLVPEEAIQSFLLAVQHSDPPPRAPRKRKQRREPTIDELLGVEELLVSTH